MTKECPNCKKQNIDSAKFCDDCGTELTSITKQKPKKTSGISGILGWWDKQGKGVKIGSIIGVCCVGLLIIGLIAAMITPNQTTNTTTSAAPTTNTSTNSPAPTPQSNLAQSNSPEYTIGNSKFRLSGGWKEGFRSEGAVGLERIRLDTSNKAIIMTQYFDKAKYTSESENAANTKTISGIKCKIIPGYSSPVWFEKNGKYYCISINNIDSSGNFEESSPDDVKYIEEIVGSIQ